MRRVGSDIPQAKAFARRNVLQEGPRSLWWQVREDLAKVWLRYGACVADGEGLAFDGSADGAPDVDDALAGFGEPLGFAGWRFVFEDLNCAVVASVDVDVHGGRHAREHCVWGGFGGFIESLLRGVSSDDVRE